MTNAQIIFNNSIALMNEGIIKGTGEFIKAVVLDEEGNEVEKTLEVPEAIHTYAAWKQAGRQVKKGEKAKAKFTIWKYNSKKEEMEVTYESGEKGTEEVETGKMFMKLSFFFTLDQTEEITK